MKNYLQAYVNHTQDDWVDHLPMAKFSANNHLNESTGITPFFADNGFCPRTSVEPLQAYQQETSQKAKLLTADKIVKQEEETRLF